MNAETTSVEVALPARNAAAYIEAAVESILSQEFDSFSLVVIDDGSNDDTAARLQRFNDPRIVVQRNRQALGVSHVLNQRLQQSPATYLAVMHADDLALPQRLSLQVEFLEAHPATAVLGSAVETFGSWQGVRRYPTEDQRLRSALLFDAPFCHSSVMFRRAALLRAGIAYQNSLQVAEDYQLWCEVPPECGLANVNEVLLRYRVHTEQASSRKAEQVLAHADQLRAQQLNRLRIVASPAELALHSKIARAVPATAVPELGSAAEWLLRLVKENEQSRQFSLQALLEEVESRWWEFCCASAVLGEAVFDCYRRSHFAGVMPRRTADLAQLLLLCARRGQCS